MLRHLKKENFTPEKFLTYIWEKRALIIILLAIFLIGVGIRGHLLRYDYLFEFDAFYHARLVQDIVQLGHVQTPDPLVYYEMGGAPAQSTTLYHLTAAFFYNLLSMGQAFNKELLMFSIRIFSVIVGSLIAVLMYFLAKDTFNNKKVGLITAFVAAVCPAFAYRTMAGAQGDNAFGFLWMVMGFIFFIRAVKTNTLTRKDIFNALLGGIFFGAMSITWGMYILIPLILVVYAPFALLLIATKQDGHEHKPTKTHAFIFFVKYLIALAVLHIISSLYGTNWIEQAFTWMGRSISMEYVPTAIITFVGIIAAAILSIFFVSKQSKENKKLIGIGVIILLYLALFVMAFVFLTVPDMHDRTSISSMVGEESNGNNFFGTKYNALIIFAWVAIALFPISIWLFNKEDSHTGIIFFIWVLITLFMAWYTLKFTFVFGLGIAIAAAVTSFLVFEGLKKFNIEKGIEGKIILVALLMLVVLGVGASARFFPDYVPYVDQNPAIREMITWINTNTTQDAKFFNWWNDGHILAFLTEKKYSSDNRNQSHIANRTMGEFVVTTDTNLAHYIISTTNPDYNFNSDYIILDKDYFTQMVSFSFYLTEKVDYSDPNVKKYSADYASARNCSVSASGADCDGATIPLNEYNALPTTWVSTPTMFMNGTTPIFIYRQGNSIIIIGNAINNSNFAKVWFNSDETKNYYTQVYENNVYKIYKIQK